MTKVSIILFQRQAISDAYKNKFLGTAINLIHYGKSNSKFLIHTLTHTHTHMLTHTHTTHTHAHQSSTPWQGSTLCEPPCYNYGRETN